MATVLVAPPAPTPAPVAATATATGTVAATVFGPGTTLAIDGPWRGGPAR